MRAALLLVLLLAGCATGDASGWTFTERDPGEPAALDARDAFETNLSLVSASRQIGGQWHDALDAREMLLRFEAEVPMRVEWRAMQGSASASGRCDWDADETTVKPVALGSVNMRSSDKWCELRFTPSAPLEGEPTLQWEARSRDEGAWTLRFAASYPTPMSLE